MVRPAAHPRVDLPVGAGQAGPHGRRAAEALGPGGQLRVVEIAEHEAERPVVGEPELERAAAVGPLAVVVARRLAHELGDQVGRTGRRQPVLGDARVRAADRADLAVAPRLGGHPLDRVVAVAVRAPAVVAEGVEVALRLEASAHVLDHDRVAVVAVDLRRPEADLGRALLVVRGALEQGREGPAAVGQVDVRVQDRPIPHRDRNVALEPQGPTSSARARGRRHSTGLAA